MSKDDYTLSLDAIGALENVQCTVRSARDVLSLLTADFECGKVIMDLREANERFAAVLEQFLSQVYAVEMLLGYTTDDIDRTAEKFYKTRKDARHEYENQPA